MKRLLDDLISHVRAIIVARVDVVYSGVNGFAQNGNPARNVTRRSPNLRAGKLHGAITHTIQGC
jgi:hypothetical protein